MSEKRKQQTTPRKGCWECRRRKLRCDGKRPTCQTCQVREIVCPGYTEKKPLTWLPTGATSRLRNSIRRVAIKSGLETVGTESDSSPEVAALHLVGKGRKRNAVARKHQNSLGPGRPRNVSPIWPAPIDLRPTQWDFIDLMVFHKTHIVPAIMSKHGDRFPVRIQEVNLDFLSPLSQSTRYSLLAQHFVYRIKFTSKANRLALEPTNSGPLAALWANFYRCVGSAIGALNEEIVQNTSSSVGGLLMSIALLVSAEINICSMPVWRAHVAGFFTLMQQCGGVRKVLSQLNRESRYYTQMFILLMFEYNATSPRHDQITQIYDLTMDDWVDIVATDDYAIFYPTYSCADPLFLCAIEIAYLRREHFLGTVTQSETDERLYDIICRLHEFSPKDWLESKRQQGLIQAPIIAYVYKPTMILFGILSIPCADPFIRAELKRMHRFYHADIMQVLELAMREDIALDYILLAVVIGGFSTATMGTAADRALVERYLLRSEDDLCEGKPPRMALEVLRRFWASGKTEWDDCFDKMYTLTLI
ncbi:hypothetical protein PT974_12562 [Cladobotryum mycophilum]|uniref:Zn(2)-C6 fungal-type domain-containing protein n=1 Tax=Cladobotryum mycophilum TaxID=491253 RepID=A0ABR0S8G9_9HYPO